MKMKNNDYCFLVPKKIKISSIKKYTDDVKLFRLKSTMNPLPGQFIEVSIPGIGECPLASCSYNDKYIDLLTRNAGNVTSDIFQLKSKDSMFIRGPYGKGFPIEELKGKNLLMIAGGTGIAPVTSLIEYIEKNIKSFGKIHIYFGFRDKKYILLSERIKKWQKKFNLIVTLNKKDNNEKDNFKCETGFIQDIMERHRPDLNNTVAVLCGPEPMMESVTLELNKLGLINDKIYWSLERRMECGIGSCGRCLIQDVYVCKDGPVFRYDIIKPKLDNEKYSNDIK